MPKEFLWQHTDYLPFQDQNLYDLRLRDCAEQYLAIRFRRPVLVQPKDIISSLTSFLQSMSFTSQVSIEPVEKVEPVIIREPSYSDTTYSYQHLWVLPLYLPNTHDGWGHLCISQNIPIKTKGQAQATSYFCYTLPLTIVFIGFGVEYLWQFTRSQFAQERLHSYCESLRQECKRWISQVLPSDLKQAGYNLVPEFDPKWTHVECDLNCTNCGREVMTVPLDKESLKVGDTELHYCRCGGSDMTERQFVVTGAWPISDDEWKVYETDAIIMADSCD